MIEFANMEQVVLQVGVARLGVLLTKGKVESRICGSD
jgi:hypothetical protein